MVRSTPESSLGLAKHHYRPATSAWHDPRSIPFHITRRYDRGLPKSSARARPLDLERTARMKIVANCGVLPFDRNSVPFCQKYGVSSLLASTRLRWSGAIIELSFAKPHAAYARMTGEFRLIFVFSDNDVRGIIGTLSGSNPVAKIIRHE
jgi:hypothetical protein